MDDGIPEPIGDWGRLIDKDFTDMFSDFGDGREENAPSEQKDRGGRLDKRRSVEIKQRRNKPRDIYPKRYASHV